MNREMLIPSPLPLCTFVTIRCTGISCRIPAGRRIDTKPPVSPGPCAATLSGFIARTPGSGPGEQAATSADVWNRLLADPCVLVPVEPARAWVGVWNPLPVGLCAPALGELTAA